MKEIVDKCFKLEKSNTLETKYNYKPKRDGDRDKEAVKLRLRGRGSGYKENNKKENNEALHLCISSKYEETYNEACKQTEMLLKGIAEEYKKFAEKVNLKDKNVKYKKYELNNTPLSTSTSNTVNTTSN